MIRATIPLIILISVLAAHVAAAETASETSPTPPAESKDQPDWVGTPPKLVDDVYEMSVTVGPYTTREECDANLPEALQKALDQYVATCLGGEITRVSLPSEELRRLLIKDDWIETRQHSVGPMIQLHVLLGFDRKVKESILDACRQAAVSQRLRLTAAWTAAAIAVLAAMFGYLRIDLATAGAYRGRLRLAAVGVILALLVVTIKGFGIGN